MGLVYAPCASGALLTSPRRLQQLGSKDPTQAVELDEALQEAILHGRDGSAGFYLIVAWLNLPPEEAHAFPNAPSFAGMKLAEDFEEMNEWEIGVSGSDTQD